MNKQVRAAFDFDAQPGTGELTIRENEILTVMREVKRKFKKNLIFFRGLKADGWRGKI